MLTVFSNFLILGLIAIIDGKLILQINKKNDDIINPVSSDVEEVLGTTFYLVCDLVSTNESSLFDDQLSWVRDENLNKIQSRCSNEIPNRKSDIKEINKSIKKFDPLRLEDAGKYVCVSNKFKLCKEVKVLVRSAVSRRERKPSRENIYCSEHMFQCMSNGLCIIQHYVCDGKPDCKDGSDESEEKCNGEPCKDKITCDDGRCIPTSWCCDMLHDPNCTVTNRPKCCQRMIDSYEEMEFPLVSQTTVSHSSVSHTEHTAKYLFILVCVVSILFSIILLLLIISKVVLFAKKAAIQQQRHNLCENIALRNQTNINVIPCGLYTYRNSRTPRNNIVRNIIIDSSDVNDPLLFNPARFNIINASSIYDQPPSYVDVLRNNRLVAEPPPPYRSQEGLNSAVNEERS